MTGRKFKVLELDDHHNLSYKNRIIVNKNDFKSKNTGYRNHVEINNNNKTCVFKIKANNEVKSGEVYFNKLMTQWAQLSNNDELFIYRCKINFQDVVKITFVIRKSNISITIQQTKDLLDENLIKRNFLKQFSEQALTEGQSILLKISDLKVLHLTVNKLQLEPNGTNKTNTGIIRINTEIIFEDEEEPEIIVEEENSNQMIEEYDPVILGIGGLKHELEEITRTVINSREIPDKLRKIFGQIHVRGILLYGPPGTGKTLIGGIIGKMLKAKEENIKLVKASTILQKTVGSSERNMDKLFSKAEKDYEKELKEGIKSQLYVFIFDEIDSICKQRGSLAGDTGVSDRIVNELLIRLDGIKQLDNILVIGTTNRKELIDEALLRPGRLEVHIQIRLPDEEGRKQILLVHTDKMRKANKLANDVKIEDLARDTAGFSGAEIAGLVRDAVSFAFQPFVKFDKKALGEVFVNQKHINQALHRFNQLSGKKNELSCLIVDGIITWCEETKSSFDNLKHLIDLTKVNKSGLNRILITGAPCTGKTALSAQLAIDFKYVELCSPADMVGLTENNKCLQIKKKFINAYKSTISCVLIDDIELLLEYREKGPHYSNSVLQTLLVFLRNEPPPDTNLFILCTSSIPFALENMELRSLFSTVVDVPNLTQPKHILNVIEYLHSNNDGKNSIFNEDEIAVIKFLISDKDFRIGIKTMMKFIYSARQMKETERIAGFLSMIFPEESLIFKEKIELDSRGLNKNVLSYNIELIYESINSVNQKKSFELMDTTVSTLEREIEGFENNFERCMPINNEVDTKYFKAESVIDHKVYAILLFPFLHDRYKDSIMKDIKLFSKLNSKFTLQYKSSWIIEDEQRMMKFREFLNFKCVFIQMELWSKTLTEFYKQIYSELQCKNFLYETMIGFYIMSELIEELFEDVNYLHQNNISYKELHKNNIMISDFTNGRTVKITVFCIAKKFSNRDNMNRSHSTHTLIEDSSEYRALEHWRYYERIYFLGKISTKFFGIDLKNIEHIHMFVKDINNDNFKSSIKSKIYNLFHLVEKMTGTFPEQMQSSREVGNNLKKYCVSLEDWNNLIAHIRRPEVENNPLINNTANYCEFILSKFSYRIINDYPNQTVRDTGLSVENKHYLFSKILGKEIVNSYNGFYFCILKSNEGKLYSFGENMFNQLGYKTINECNYTPKLIELVIGNVIDVSCGRNHILALTEDKNVYSWGSNNIGELGRSSRIRDSIPRKIYFFDPQYPVSPESNNLKSISCGSEHSMALTGREEQEDTHVFSWGNNIYGQLGDGSTTNVKLPIKIKIDYDAKISKISCGRIHSLLLSTDGDIYSFGANYNCQLGWTSTESNKQTEPKPTKLESIIKFKEIRCHWRGDFSTALSTKDECYIWGKCGTKVIEKPTLVSEILMPSEIVTCEQAVDELISENIRILSNTT